MENLNQEMFDARQMLVSNFIEYGRFLEKYDLEDSYGSYEKFINHGTMDNEEKMQIIDCFFALADSEGIGNIVIINNSDPDDVVMLSRGFSYEWKDDLDLTIHIEDEENKIDIVIGDIIEDDFDEDSIYVGGYTIEVF